MKIKAAIFDLDNTLTNAHWRSHLAESKQWDAFFNACDGDTLNQEMAEKLRWHKAQGHQIHFLTGRKESTRAKTIAWLEKHSINYDLLLMRPDGVFSKDYEIKQAMLDFSKYAYTHAYDDMEHNVTMFQANGIPSTLVKISEVKRYLRKCIDGRGGARLGTGRKASAEPLTQINIKVPESVLAWLDKQPQKSKYIINLIRVDMEKNT